MGPTNQMYNLTQVPNTSWASCVMCWCLDLTDPLITKIIWLEFFVYYLKSIKQMQRIKALTILVKKTHFLNIGLLFQCHVLMLVITLLVKRFYTSPCEQEYQVTCNKVVYLCGNKQKHIITTCSLSCTSNHLNTSVTIYST